MDNHPRSVRVVLAVPALLGWGLARLVQSAQPRLELSGAAGTHEQAMPLVERHGADVLVVAADGLAPDVLRELCARTTAKVLVTTASGDPAWLDAIVLAGVRGVVKLADAPPVFLKAIDKVHEGELWIDRRSTSRLFMEMARQQAARHEHPERARIATLTMRERQTIAALASDAAAPGKVVAQRLCISEHTLRNHLTSIYNKLGLSNRVDLYAYAMRHRLHELRPAGDC